MKKRRVWISAFVLCVALMAIVLKRERGAEYTRFVSPLLGGGTRYTFLYPARFTRTAGRGLPIVLMLFDRPQPTGFRLVRKWLGQSPAHYLPPRQGQIIVDVGVLQAGVPKNSRSEKRDQKKRIFSVNDARSGFSFYVLQYGVDPARLDRENKILSDSFRILPPGAPVPSP